MAGGLFVIVALIDATLEQSSVELHRGSTSFKISGLLYDDVHVD
jgi:hypothetical protein